MADLGTQKMALLAPEIKKRRPLTFKLTMNARMCFQGCQGCQGCQSCQRCQKCLDPICGRNSKTELWCRQMLEQKRKYCEQPKNGALNRRPPIRESVFSISARSMGDSNICHRSSDQQPDCNLGGGPELNCHPAGCFILINQRGRQSAFSIICQSLILQKEE